jgi:Domain of Unknown Function (DUF1206)
VVIAGIGIAALDAAVTYDAAKAKGVDGALRSFAQSPFGPWLLILVALGLIAFGILSFLEAKWRRTFGGVPVWIRCTAREGGLGVPTCGWSHASGRCRDGGQVPVMVLVPGACDRAAVCDCSLCRLAGGGGGEPAEPL